MSLTLGLALGTLTGCSLSGKGSAAVRSKPNILFCLADDASYPHMGAYGCKWVNTPAFDKVAANGVLFTNAYTPNAKCAPSRASILTGRNSWQLEDAGNHMALFPAKFKTYAETLVKNGYDVGATGKGWMPGVAGNDENGQPRELCGKLYMTKKLSPPTAEIHPCDYAGNFEVFLKDRKPDQPFCFWYGSNEPHRAYEYGTGISKGGKKLSDIDRVFDFWPDNETVRTDMLDYAYELEYFDSHLQKMLDILEENGELDNTIVVVTADNGMPFPRVKGQAYEHSNHLPLAIMWKDGIKNPGRQVDDFVSFIDFAPTFLEVAGVKEASSGMLKIEGKSLTDILYSKKSGIVNKNRDYVLIGQERHDIGRPNDWGYPIRGIVKGEFFYIINFKPERWPACNPETGYLNCDGSPTKTVCLDARENEDTKKYWQWSFGKRPNMELYNIRKDPDCMNNLAGEQAYQPVVARLKKQLFDELTKQGDPRMFGNGDVFDNYDVCWPEYRDFYERFNAGEKFDLGWVNPSDFRPIP